MSVTIKSLGLKEYLNRTRSQHNNYGFDDFEGFIQRGVSKRAIANIYGVAWQTAYNWIKQYEADQKGSN